MDECGNNGDYKNDSTLFFGQCNIIYWPLNIHVITL